MVNVPVRLDLSAQYTRAVTITAQNGSRRIRTFAGDDVIHASGEGGASIDGGAGFNVVVYPRSRSHYSLRAFSSDLWSVVTSDGAIDTLTRIQRVDFRD